MLGSNIGTTTTSILAAMASKGDRLPNSLQVKKNRRTKEVSVGFSFDKYDEF